MRWIYVPIMFSLAFAYTKFSFNDLGNKTTLKKSLANRFSRAPASEKSSKLKFKAIALKRVPASVLYKNLSEISFLDVFHKVAVFRGTVIGNPSVESFGYIIDDKSKTTYSVREFSEVSEGLYLHDVLGHLVSAKTIAKNVSWINYFEAYKSGLQDQPHIFSYYIEKGLEDAAFLAQKQFEDNVTQDFPFEFTQMKKTNIRVELIKKNLIQVALKKKFPRIQFFDLFESIHGKKKYHLLARIRPQDKIQWIVMDDSNDCDYDLAFNLEPKAVPFDKRFELLKNNLFNGKLNQALDSVVIDKKNYILKFLDHFPEQLALRDIPTDDYLDIIIDQAYILGKIHKASLRERADDYIKSWATIPGAVVDEKTIELKYRLKDLQE